jgi:hypothetical protein
MWGLRNGIVMKVRLKQESAMNGKWISSALRWFANLFLVLTCILSYGQDLFPSSTTRVIAGQNTDVGRVTCGYVTGSLTEGRCDVQLDDGWCVGLAHVYVGEQKPVSMAPGQFPFQSRPPSCVANWSIPIRWVAGQSCGALDQFIAFHAEVSRANGGQQETAWGKGIATGVNWSMLFKLDCARSPR